MTRYYSIARLSLALLAVLALAGPAAAEGQENQERQVPFQGVIEAVSNNEIHFPTMSVNLTGGGTATHLGRYTFTLEGTVDLRNGTGVGSADFIAANGDSLSTTFVGQGVPTGRTPTENRVTETYTITGGTGRFDGAGGSFTIVRLVDTATGETSGSFEGAIVFAKE
jgi:hypothetical protein